MNQPPNQSGSNVPPGYGAPQQPAGYGPPPSNPGYPPQYPQGPGPVPHSGSYAPPPQGHPQQAYAPPQSYPQQQHGFRGMTRQMFNPATYRQQGSGSWAAASLILSLVSAFLCLGFISPLPMLLGLIGMIGNKRAKGMAFAGFLISAVQVVGWVAIFGLGLHVQFQGEKLATEAGAPVVAAIEEFKNDNKRVPHSLDELVDMGYLPETWTAGTEDLSSFVKEDVQDKKWTDFLRYKAGGDAQWDGKTGFVEAARSDNAEDLLDAFGIPSNAEAKAYQSYGLAFVGIDGSWNTSDDSPVKQDGEKYDLAKLWGGNDATREAMKTKRELRTMMNQLEVKIKGIDKSIDTYKASIAKNGAKLDEIVKRKKLSKANIRKDSEASQYLQLIGETNKLVLLSEEKRGRLQSTYTSLEVQMERLANQVEWAKSSENRDELAKLEQLLKDSRKTAETDGYFSDISDTDAADKWLDDYYEE